jgi:hypothetical protein
MTNKKMKKIIEEISNNYISVREDRQESQYIYNGIYEKQENDASDAIYQKLNITTDTAIISSHATRAIWLLEEYFDSMDNIRLSGKLDVYDEQLTERIWELCDTMSIYHYDNNQIIAAYGLDEAIELYKGIIGDSMQGLNAGALAYYIHEELTTAYIYTLIEGLEKLN